MKFSDLDAAQRSEKFHDLPSARDYWLGRVVSKKQNDHRLYGHIVGFKRTNMGEVGIVVMWEGGDEDMIHHANIDLH